MQDTRLQRSSRSHMRRYLTGSLPYILFSTRFSQAKAVVAKRRKRTLMRAPFCFPKLNFPNGPTPSSANPSCRPTGTTLGCTKSCQSQLKQRVAIVLSCTMVPHTPMATCTAVTLSTRFSRILSIASKFCRASKFTTFRDGIVTDCRLNSRYCKQ